jgi:type I restriction enzyme S subunit
MKYASVSLGNLLTLERRRILVEREELYPEVGVYCFGRGLFHKPPRTGLEVGDKPLFKIRNRDFILQVTFAWEGAVAVASENDEGYYGSIRVLTFRVNEIYCIPEFLLYYFKTPEGREQLIRISPGSAGRNRVLSIKRIPEVIVPLPPLQEQRRIVAKIEKLAAKIAEAHGLRNQSLAEIQTVMGNAARHIFTKLPDDTWVEGCIDDYVMDICYGTSERAYDEPIGIPILRMGNIQDGRLDIMALKYLQIAERDREKWILRSHDILVNRTNSAELVGKCAVFNLHGDWGFASYLIRLRLDPNRADPRLVACYINSPLGREYMFRERKQMTGQANVNSKKLKALPIKLPPINEQHRIMAWLDGLQAKVDALERLQTEVATELDALLPSILDKAFKGEL